MQSGALRTAARLRAPAAVILAYHSVRDNPEIDSDWLGPGITHATSVFARQMELVARRFHPVTLDDILLFVKGEKELPRRAVAITFDDGYLDNLELAAPVLQRFGISAAFYVTVGLIGREDAPWFARIRHAFMTTPRRTWTSAAQNRSWDISTASARDVALRAAYDSCAALAGPAQYQAVRDLEQALDVDGSLPQRRLMMSASEIMLLRRTGHIVGCHTLTHPNVAHLNDYHVMQSEVAGSKHKLEQHLQQPVQHFSYPHPALHPQWNGDTVAATRMAGYLTAVTTTKGPIGIGSDPLLLTRINAPRPEHEFLWNLERAFVQNRRGIHSPALVGETYL